jgi:hypothetical protein
MREVNKEVAGEVLIYLADMRKTKLKAGAERGDILDIEALEELIWSACEPVPPEEPGKEPKGRGINALIGASLEDAMKTVEEA